jgi:hypothetical protein
LHKKVTKLKKVKAWFVNCYFYCAIIYINSLPVLQI